MPRRRGTRPDDVIRAIRAAAHRGAMRSGLVLEAEIVKMLSRPGTGRVYRRGGVVHRASAPGEPPAVDTGTLRGSIGHEDRSTATVVRVRVGVGPAAQQYARRLEFGSEKVEARPFMRPSVQLARPAMRRAMLAELRGVKI